MIGVGDWIGPTGAGPAVVGWFGGEASADGVLFDVVVDAGGRGGIADYAVVGFFLPKCISHLAQYFVGTFGGEAPEMLHELRERDVSGKQQVYVVWHDDEGM